MTDEESYKNNPEAQEKYQNYLGGKYKKTVANFKDNYKLNTPDETLMALTHYLGAGDANVYLKVLSETKDYDKAQAAVDASIRGRSKDGILPKNKNVQEYLDIFNNKLKGIKESSSSTTTSNTPSAPTVAAENKVVDKTGNESIDFTLDFENTKKYKNYGFTSYNGTLNKEQAAEKYKKEYLPLVKDLPKPLQVVAGDFNFNSENPYPSLMVAAGIIDTKGKIKLYTKENGSNLRGYKISDADKAKILEEYNKDPKKFLDSFDAERERSYAGSSGVTKEKMNEWKERIQGSREVANKLLPATSAATTKAVETKKDIAYNPLENKVSKVNIPFVKENSSNIKTESEKPVEKSGYLPTEKSAKAFVEKVKSAPAKPLASTTKAPVDDEKAKSRSEELKDLMLSSDISLTQKIETIGNGIKKKIIEEPYAKIENLFTEMFADEVKYPDASISKAKLEYSLNQIKMLKDQKFKQEKINESNKYFRDLPDLSHGDQYNLDKLTFGHRNKGERTEVKTRGMVVQTINPITKDKKNFNYDSKAQKIIAVDNSGKMYFPNSKEEIKDGSAFTKANYYVVTDFDGLKKTKDTANGTGTYYPSLIDENGKAIQYQVGATPNDNTRTSGMYGGKLLVISQDGKHKQLFVGSVDKLQKDFYKFKDKTNSIKLTVVQLDEGSFHNVHIPNDGSMSKADWESYEALNVAGSHGFYIN